MVFEEFNEAFNLYTGSKNVVGLFPTIETALLAENTGILLLLMKLQKLIQNRTYKFYVGHIRGHTKLPRPLPQGNELAESYTRIFTALEQAKDIHNLHHQNALALKRAFGKLENRPNRLLNNVLPSSLWGQYRKWVLIPEE